MGARGPDSISDAERLLEVGGCRLQLLGGGAEAVSSSSDLSALDGIGGVWSGTQPVKARGTQLHQSDCCESSRHVKSNQGNSLKLQQQNQEQSK